MVPEKGDGHLQETPGAPPAARKPWETQGAEPEPPVGLSAVKIKKLKLLSGKFIQK